MQIEEWEEAVFEGCLRGRLLLITLFMWSQGIVRRNFCSLRASSLVAQDLPTSTFPFTLSWIFRECFIGADCLYAPFSPNLWCLPKRHKNPCLASYIDLKETPFLATIPAEEKIPSFPLQSRECRLVIAKAFPCQFSSHLRYSQLVFPLGSPYLFPP